MGKVTVQHADMFTAGLLKAAFENLRATDSPTTTFQAGDVEFQLTLKRLNGSPVLSRTERQLLDRVKHGQQDLNPREIRIAQRVLKRLP